MTEDSPPAPDSGTSAGDPSSLKGLTMALGIEPAKPGQDSLLGCDIGGVTIIRLIAEGGMGRVYEGKQEKPNRTVAVKVMRPGLTSPSILKRFEYEAEVLGRLQHPGIAHIYSVGVHRVGNATVPYFVMEYIADARSLTQYADDLRLPTRQRLDLFRSVCDAVAHGHQKGVIHRDLKPSNILVDATGQPKVIDFGVARATDSDMALTTMQTDVGQLIGTLQYMSPEQFRADPNDIDVRSDVYALGVILYELLAGKMPYNVKKKAIHEVARIVQEDDPTPLSNFNRALRGDVAVIAGKCLEKERGRRYSSASELGSDVGRYLSGEAISASAPGFIDGLLRLSRKHRAAATAVGAVIATLIIAVIGISYFAFIASAARQVAIRERQRAEDNAEESRAQAAEARVQREKADAKALEASVQESRATAAAVDAKNKLYIAMLYRLSTLITAHDIPAAHVAWRDALHLYQQQKAGGTQGGDEKRIAGTPTPQANESMQNGLATDHPANAELPFELRELGSRLDDAILVLRPLAGSVVAVSYNITGDRIAGGCSDGKLMIWNTTNGGVLVSRDAHSSAITRVVYSVDGKQLLTASRDNTAKVWDAAAAHELATLRGHGGAIRDAAFSPDGRYVATASQDGTIRLWDPASGKQLQSFQCHGRPAHSVSFSADGKRLAVAGEHKDASLWEVETGAQLAVLAAHWGNLTSVVFNRDGTTLATVSGWNDAHNSYDESLRLWDGVTGKEISCVRRCQNASVTFSPDGKRVVTTGAAVVGWDAAGLRATLTLKGHTQHVYMSTFSPDGRRVATASRDKTVRVWDAITGDELAVLHGHLNSVFQVRFSPNGSQLASLSSDGTVRLWDVGAGVVNNVCRGHGGWIFSLAVSPDGGRVVTGSWDKTVRIWDTTTCTQLGILKGHRRDVEGVAISADGQKLGTASVDRTARIWDAITGSEVAVLNGHGDDVEAIAFSPNGEEVATASADKTARIWSAVSGAERLVLKGHQKGLRAVAYSPDGQYVVTGSDDGTACMWNVTTGDCERKMMGHRGTIWSVMFSPDGRRIATASEDGTARIWQASTGAELLLLKGHAMCVRGVAYDPGGSRVVTGSLDNTCRVWNAETGEELLVMSDDTRQVAVVKFSADGQFVVSGGGDGVAKIRGWSNAERYAARLQDAELRKRLEPVVRIWCSEGPENVGEEITKAKQSMMPAQYREAVKMIFEQLKRD